MSEYIFRNAPGFGCDMSGYMDDGRTVIGEFYAKHNTDHYGTIHEEVVRCMDCRHYRFVDRSDIFHDERHNDSFCLRFVGGKLMEVEPNGFCAWGERK